MQEVIRNGICGQCHHDWIPTEGERETIETEGLEGKHSLAITRVECMEAKWADSMLWVGCRDLAKIEGVPGNNKHDWVNR